jgi:hypothetical protein
VLSSKLALLILLAIPACSLCHAADKEHPELPPVLLAGMGEGIPSLSGLSPNVRPASAGVSNPLPEMPEFQGTAPRHPGAPLSFYLFRFGAALEEQGVEEPKEQKQNLESPIFDESQQVSLLNSSPLSGAARRIRADRFNTDDGSMMYDFAICYRLSRWSSVEVIPGDPAPVKIPVTQLSNNMGVTVGMVVRLNRLR